MEITDNRHGYFCEFFLLLLGKVDLPWRFVISKNSFAPQLLLVCRRWRLFARAGGSACSPLLANSISAAAKRKKTHPRPTLQTLFVTCRRSEFSELIRFCYILRFIIRSPSKHFWYEWYLFAPINLKNLDFLLNHHSPIVRKEVISDTGCYRMSIYIIVRDVYI